MSCVLSVVHRMTEIVMFYVFSLTMRAILSTVFVLLICIGFEETLAAISCHDCSDNGVGCSTCPDGGNCTASCWTCDSATVPTCTAATSCLIINTTIYTPDFVTGNVFVKSSPSQQTDHQHTHNDQCNPI